ncbi:hypothetical protein MTO96_048728 [Rhipicephalus appendiculatus]
MMMNEEAQWMLMATIKESPLQATPVVADALATRESTDKNPDGTTTASNVGEMKTGPAPQVKRGGGGELLPAAVPD